MSARRFMTAAEVAVLDAQLPEKLTPDMRSVAVAMFEALVLLDERAGTARPDGAWLKQLQRWANQVLAQMQHLATEVGGQAIYFAKGVSMHLSARDREMCGRFRGDYKALAREYGLTEMRVRQIVDAWQREQFLRRQGDLLGGLGTDDAGT